MNEIECPYCGYSYDLSHDDGAFYDENNRTKEQCPKCEKYFMVSSSLSWYFSADKANCLNGGQHKWEQIVGAPREYFIGRQRCSECDEERKI